MHQKATTSLLILARRQSNLIPTQGLSSFHIQAGEGREGGKKRDRWNQVAASPLNQLIEISTKTVQMPCGLKMLQRKPNKILCVASKGFQSNTLTTLCLTKKAFVLHGGASEPDSVLFSLAFFFPFQQYICLQLLRFSFRTSPVLL